MKLCVALDDFSEEIMGDKEWKVLLDLKKEYPNLKITMFTIPGQCSREWLLKMSKERHWIEMGIHGDKHIRKEFDINNVIASKVSLWFTSFNGMTLYKAPWWDLELSQFNELHKWGIKVATNKTNDFKGDYVYDDGREVIKDICYELDNGVYTWHGHVQSQRKANPHNPNGLPDVVDLFKKHIPKDTKFMFVSEVIENGS